MDWALTGATVGLIIASCHLLDWLVSKKEEDQQKITIVKWWSRLDDFSYGEAVRNSNIFCNELFDKIYGKEHLSLRCLGISCCVSIISVTTISIFVYRITGFSYFGTEPITGSPILVIIGTALLINFWPDYLSLVETRIILRFASRVKPLMLPVLLLVDLCLTAIIFIPILLPPIADDIGFVLKRGVSLWQYEYEVLVNIITFEDLFSIYFYSTFSTSIVFYIYCLSTLFFKFLKLSKTRIMIVLEKLENSDHLFKALGGFLAAVLVFVKCVVEVIQRFV